MERASVGDRWAFGRPHQPFVTPRKRRVSGVAAMVSVLVMLAGFPAFADGIQGDADALATSAPSANGLNADQTIGGPAVLYDYSAVVENNNRTVDDVFAVSGDTVSATLSVTQDFSWPVSFDTEFTGTNAFTAYGQNKAGKLSVTVPSTATADQVNHIKVTITATASNGRALSPDKVELNYNITAKAPSAPANSAPVVTAPGNQTADEGTSKSFNLGSFSDSGPSPWDVTVNWGDGTSDTTFQMTAAGAITAQSHTYADNGTYTVTVTVKDAGSPQLSDSKTFQVVVSNVAPTVVAGFASASVDCQNQATLNVAPDDLGVNDAPWKVNISWGDGNSEPEISRTNLDSFQVTHTYALANVYNATVSVTDKDGDTGSDNSNAITVTQEYSVTFLQPFDQSTPTKFVINKAKAGRVVPVKVQIYDVCAQAAYESPSAAPRIAVNTTNAAGTTSDSIEVYADAGTSNSGDKYFRWSADGFWIYNLDTRTILNGGPLVTGNHYRIDVWVTEFSGTKATDDEFALLQSVR